MKCPLADEHQSHAFKMKIKDQFLYGIVCFSYYLFPPFQDLTKVGKMSKIEISLLLRSAWPRSYTWSPSRGCAGRGDMLIVLAAIADHKKIVKERHLDL